MTDIEKRLNEYMMKQVETQGQDGISWALPSIVSAVIGGETKTEKKCECGKCEKDKETQNDATWALPAMMTAMAFGLAPKFDNASYQQGKIDAYENLLKGFDK